MQRVGAGGAGAPGGPARGGGRRGGARRRAALLVGVRRPEPAAGATRGSSRSSSAPRSSRRSRWSARPRGGGPRLGRLLGLPGRMAARGVVAKLSRTGVAVAALMVAVAATVGVGVMIRSFRATVVRWLETSLVADVYVSAPTFVRSRGGGVDPRCRPWSRGSARRPASWPSGTYRGVRVASALGPTQLVALGIGPGSYRQFRLPGGIARRRVAGLPGRRRGDRLRALRLPARPRVGSALRLRTDRGRARRSRWPACSRTTARTRAW